MKADDSVLQSARTHVSKHHKPIPLKTKTTNNLPPSEIHILSAVTPLPADTHAMAERLVQLVVKHAVDSGAYADGVKSTLPKLLPSFHNLRVKGSYSLNRSKEAGVAYKPVTEISARPDIAANAHAISRVA